MVVLVVQTLHQLNVPHEYRNQHFNIGKKMTHPIQNWITSRTQQATTTLRPCGGPKASRSKSMRRNKQTNKKKVKRHYGFNALTSFILCFISKLILFSNYTHNAGKVDYRGQITPQWLICV